MNIDKLREEIDRQTRNGREDIYVHTGILEELGVRTFSKGMVFIKLDQLNKIIKVYEKKQSEKDMER